jgi:signal transduction histidine kinase
MDEDARHLAVLITNNRSVIEQRWLARVESDVVSGGSVIEPTHLRDGLPDYLLALAELFSGDAGRVRATAEPAWAKVAREHGVTRVRIGFDINQLVHEFIILRQTIREVALENGMRIGSGEANLADALDAAIAAAVSAYVDARDFDARKKQAENVGFLTHELRNPLSTAILNASHVRRHAVPQQVPHLDKLDRSHQRLNDLIDSVLLNERLEAGHVASQPVEVELGELLPPALEAARETAARKSLEFRTRFDPNLRVFADPQLTRSAMQNVADNAVKYTDVGYVEVTVEERADTITIHVRDTCEGISEEELRTIFEPFERGNSRKSGTGLGLAIAREAVDAQGGRIHAESPGSSGCHFWIELPKGPGPGLASGHS